MVYTKRYAEEAKRKEKMSISSDREGESAATYTKIAITLFGLKNSKVFAI